MRDDLYSFFAENTQKIDREKVDISARFKKNGEPLLWEIACINALENNALRRQCFLKNGEFDAGAYQSKLAVACVLFPNLEDIELQNSYGVKTAESLIGTMLSPGEFEILLQKILEINGFKTEEELVKQAKN